MGKAGKNNEEPRSGDAETKGHPLRAQRLKFTEQKEDPARHENNTPSPQESAHGQQEAVASTASHLSLVNADIARSGFDANRRPTAVDLAGHMMAVG